MWPFNQFQPVFEQCWMIFEMRQPATGITPNLGNHNWKIDWTMVQFSLVLWIFLVHRTEPANTMFKWALWSSFSWESQVVVRTEHPGCWWPESSTQNWVQHFEQVQTTIGKAGRRWMKDRCCEDCLSSMGLKQLQIKSIYVILFTSHMLPLCPG